MLEDENISELNICLGDIANKSFILCEKMSCEKLVIKILRSLSKRFDMKVNVVEEAQNIFTLKFNELIRSLLTFVMFIDVKYEREKK